MKLERYILVDRDDHERDGWYGTLADAQRLAGKLGCAIILQTYELEDSELVWTPDGSETWPPEKGKTRED